MGEYNSTASLGAMFRELFSRVSALERTDPPVRGYTTATLPDPTTVPRLIVLDSTTGEFKGSNGTAWVVLG